MKKQTIIMSQDSHKYQSFISEEVPLIVIKGDMNEQNCFDPSVLNQMPIIKFNFNKVISLLKPSHDLGKKKYEFKENFKRMQLSSKDIFKN